MKRTFFRNDYRRQIGCAAAALLATGLFAVWKPAAAWWTYPAVWLFFNAVFYSASIRQAGKLYLADKYDQSHKG